MIETKIKENMLVYTMFDPFKKSVERKGIILLSVPRKIQTAVHITPVTMFPIAELKILLLNRVGWWSFTKSENDSTSLLNREI